MTTPVKQFQVGKQYTGRFACDSEQKLQIVVARRTAKTLTTWSGKLLRIGVHNDEEFVRPLGNYSMAPIIRAS